MSVIISATSGLWADGTTWVGGVAPIATDDIVIAAGHTVTVAVSPAPLEKTLDIYGTLQLNENIQTGVNLTTRMCAVTGHPGGNIIIASGKNWWTGQGIYRLKGAVDNWFHVSGDGGMTHPAATSYKMQWDCEYTSFRNTGEMRLHLGATSGHASIVSDLIAKNCVFRNDLQYIYFGTAGYSGPTSNIRLTDCDIRGLASPRFSRSSATTGETVCTRCTFGQLDKSAGLTNTSGGVARLVDCTIVNSGPGTGPQASTSPWDVSGGFLAESRNDVSALYLDQKDAASLSGAYLHTANRLLPSVNSRSAIGAVFLDCICETFGTAPNSFILSSSLAPTTMARVEGCLHIGNGDCATLTNACVFPSTIKNNTVVLHNGGAFGGVCLLEKGTSAIPPSLRNNVLFSLAAQSLDSTIRNDTGVGYVFNIDSDYNSIWNVASFIGPHSAYSAGYDTHSIRVDPMFTDPTRLLETWVKQYTGSPEATWETAYSLMLDINGYNAVTGTQKPATTPANIAKIAFEWVAAGYVPRNGALGAAGEGGTHIGAFPVQHPAQQFTASGVVNTSGLPYGSSPSTASRSAIINIPDGWTVLYFDNLPRHGALTDQTPTTVTYLLSNPSETQDSFSIRLNGAGGALGILTVTITIVQEAPNVSIPTTMAMAGEVDSFNLTFNAFASRPGTITYDIGEGAIVPDQYFTQDGVTGVLSPDSLYKVSGPGGGGGIFTVAASPKFPKVLLCSCDMGGAYRSIDDGATWKMIPNFVGVHIGPGVVFCNDEKNTMVWAGRAVSGGTDFVAISNNTGVSWDKSARLPIQSVTGTAGIVYNSPICAEAFSTGCLIGSKLDGLLYFDPLTKAFKIIDSNTEKDPESVSRGVWFVAVDGNTIYYTSSKELRKVTYSGGVFGTPQTIYTAPNYIVGYSFGGGHHYATIKGDGVYRSTDAVTWTRIYDFYWQTWIHKAASGALYMAASRHTAFYASDVFSYTAAETEAVPIRKSLDNGDTWVTIFNIGISGNVERTWVQNSLSWLYYFMLNGFCVVSNTTHDKDILFASSQGELFRTDNGGVSWTAPYRKALTKLGAESDRSQSIGLEVTSCWGLKEDIHNPDIWYGMWTDISGQVSFDKGNSWSPANSGVPANTRNTLYGIAQDPATPNKVWGAFAGVHDIPYDGYVSGVSGNGGVFVSTDNGLTWTRPYTPGVTGPTSQTCTDVIFHSSTGILYATVYGQAFQAPDPYTVALYANAGVWKSVDGGANWTRISTGLDAALTGNLHMYRLSIGPEGGIYALKTYYQSNGSPGGIFKKNPDDTWTMVGPVGPAGSSWNLWPTAITFGKTEQEIYVTAVNRYSTDKGLMHTSDGGATWAALWSMDIPGEYDYMMSAYVDGDFILLGGACTGPWLSWNHGKDWHVWEDFPFQNIQSITKLKDGRLACTTFGAGIFIFNQPQLGGQNLGYSAGTLKVQSEPGVAQSLPIGWTFTSSAGTVNVASTVITEGGGADLSQTGRFKEIADAIRAKEGSTDLIAPSQFAAHILAL